MSFGDVTENNIMLLIFNATAIALIADNAATTPETSIGWALHEGDPGEAGTQLTNEAAYTSYARVDLLRSATDHAVAANSVSPTSNVEFPTATGSSNDIDYFSVGYASTNILIMSGTVTPNIAVVNTVQPILTTASAMTID